MNDCIFCKIAKKELKAKIIAENEKAIAFLDIQPKSPGHALVIPKGHYLNLLEVPEEELAPLFSLVKKVLLLLKEKLNPDGFNVGYNHGEVAGQVVNHLHIHIIPRYKEDGGRPIQSLVDFPPSDLEEIYQKIVG